MTKYIRALVGEREHGGYSLGRIYQVKSEPGDISGERKLFYLHAWNEDKSDSDCFSREQYEFVTEEVARKERPEWFVSETEKAFDDMMLAGLPDIDLNKYINFSAINDNLPSNYEPPKPEPKQPLSYLNNDKEREEAERVARARRTFRF